MIDSYDFLFAVANNFGNQWPPLTENCLTKIEFDLSICNWVIVCNIVGLQTILELIHYILDSSLSGSSYRRHHSYDYSSPFSWSNTRTNDLGSCLYSLFTRQLKLFNYLTFIVLIYSIILLFFNLIADFLFLTST